MLKGNVVECDVINIKRGDIFLKLVDLTKELEGPHLIMDTILYQGRNYKNNWKP
jgi:hypothetical protein